MDLKQLAAPFPASDVEWRVQSAGEKNGQTWARVLAYITNRAIMERLDDVCGPANWRNEFRHEATGAVLCGISIKYEDASGFAEWVTKWDGAENTDIEAVKGGLSNAMKRAGVQWGIGRYLYELEEGYANVHANGRHYQPKKDGKYAAFKWDAPALPMWALPGGSGKASGANEQPTPQRASSPASTNGAPSATMRAASGNTSVVERVRAEVKAVEEKQTQSRPTFGANDDEPSCPKCGCRMWDNRISKKNPKAPDFKCRQRSCDGVVWPRRSEPEVEAMHYSGDDFPAALRDDQDLDLPY